MKAFYRTAGFTFFVINFFNSPLLAQEPENDSTFQEVSFYFGQNAVSDHLPGPVTPIETDNAPAPVYRMNYWISGAFSLVATAADIYAIPNIIKAKKALTDQELASLNREIFTGFDRWALRQDPSKREEYYRASDYVLPVIIAGTALLGIDKNIRKDWLRLFMMYYETHAITFSLYNFSFFGPAFQNKLRPYVYYDEVPAEARKGGNQRNSMYSGHTATAVASTYFMVKVWCDYHPNIRNKKYLLYAVASVPPLIEGYLRMKALTHFPSDIMVGFAIGAFCGIAVPAIHKFKPEDMSIGLVPTPAGPGINIAWKPDFGKRKPIEGLLK